MPPLANVAYAIASWIGVTSTSPWPIAERMLSPGSQSGYGNAAGFVVVDLLLPRRVGDAARPPRSAARCRSTLPKPQFLAVAWSASPPGLLVLPAVVEVATDRVEVHVARHRERVVQVDPPGRALALERMVRVGRVRVGARVVDRLGRVDVVRAEAGDRGHQLERRARCVLARRRPGSSSGKPLALSCHCFHVGLGDAVHERVRVVVGLRRHRHDRAGRRVEHDDRAGRRRERLEALLVARVLRVARRVEPLLQRVLGRASATFEVEREPDVVARHAAASSSSVRMTRPAASTSTRRTPARPRRSDS